VDAQTSGNRVCASTSRIARGEGMILMREALRDTVAHD
jgi:hypothetical protein